MLGIQNHLVQAGSARAGNWWWSTRSKNCRWEWGPGREEEHREEEEEPLEEGRSLWLRGKGHSGGAGGEAAGGAKREAAARSLYLLNDKLGDRRILNQGLTKSDLHVRKINVASAWWEGAEPVVVLNIPSSLLSRGLYVAGGSRVWGQPFPYCVWACGTQGSPWAGSTFRS